MAKSILFGCLYFLFSCSSSHIVVNRNISSDLKFKIQFIDSKNVIPGQQPKLISLDLKTQFADFESNINELTVQSEQAQQLSTSKNKIETVEDSILYDPANKVFKKSLVILKDLIAEVRSKNNENEKNEILYQISLVTNAMMNNYLPPLKVDYDILKIPLYILKYTYSQRINKEATTLDSKIDPEGSYLWTNNKNIGSQNLYSYRYETIANETCNYEKAKSGFGIHPGFHIECKDQSYKLKFGNELNSGPFNSRIYQLLGYEAPQINYLESVKIKYNRKIITEYNQRKTENFYLTLAGNRVSTIYSNKAFLNPFENIFKFVLADGTFLTAEEFKNKFLKNKIEIDPKKEKNLVRDYTDEDFIENETLVVSEVIFKPATITRKTNDIEIGPWSFSDLDFSSLREMKALFILSAWLGNFDIRKDNNRLLANKKGTQKSSHNIRLALADVGWGLGQSDSLLHHSSSDINQMQWEIAHTYKDNDGDNISKDRLQMIGFSTVELNKTFENIPITDAQWMLRKICAISNNQLTQALVASGLSSAGVQLALAKLNFRKNNMIDNFGLADELKSSCSTDVNKKMNYDAKINGQVQIKTDAGEIILAPDRNEIIVNGQIQQRP
jgi:hypothetical protein